MARPIVARQQSALNNLVRRPGAVVRKRTVAPAPEPTAAFEALTYDPATYEMLGVKTGTGDLIVAASAGVKYAPDFEGVYQQYPADSAVWSGGRCVLSGGAGSPVTGVYADNGSGTPLPEVPYLQYYPAATNNCLWSRDLTNAAWSIVNGTGTRTYDQVGLTGAANTASLCTDTVGGTVCVIRSTALTVSTPGVAKFLIKKDTDVSRFVGLQLVTATVNSGLGVHLNTQTGEIIDVISPGGPFNSESIDAGDWWLVLLEGSNISNYLRVVPAADSVFGGTSNPTTGSVVVGQCEYHDGKTIAQVRGLGPIFTTTAAASTERTAYSFNTDNHSNNSSAYYAEIQVSNTVHPAHYVTTDGNVAGPLTYQGSNQFRLRDDGGSVNNTSASITADTLIKTGASYDLTTGEVNLNVDSAWTTKLLTYVGFTVSALTINRSADINAIKIRNLKRWDVTSYEQGKGIIDEEMA